MKWLKIWLSSLLVGGLVFLSVSCSSTSATATTATKTATVQKGNITVSVTGTGNLAYSHSEDLAFEMAGYVESVSVSAGDTVEEGQEIAALDTSDWDKEVRKLEDALTAAQRDLNDKTDALASTQRQVASKELAVQAAQLDLDTAVYNLSQITEVKDAQDKVDAAQNSLDITQSNLQVALAQGADTDGPRQQIDFFTNELEEAKIRLNRILDGNDVTIETTVALDIAKDQFRVLQAQKTLDDAKSAVEGANTAVKNARLDVDEAKQSVADGQSDLDEEKSLSPVVKAPFAGYITKVNVSGGDEIQKGTVAAQIADPDQFEADILITENDISSIELGGEATVSLDALSDITFPAKITEISPTATVSSGVVNYAVTVELTSLQPITVTQGTAGQQQPPAAAPSGTANSSGTASATPSTVPSGTTAASNSNGADSSRGIELKDGLSATVEIISQQVSDVLIIPSKAITRQGQNSTVQVVKGTTTETRTIKTGLTDGTNTQVTEGLNESEQVVYKVSASGSSSSTSSSGSQGGLGGMGGPPPGF
jgi:HlyD family secretion protein